MKTLAWLGVWVAMVPAGGPGQEARRFKIGVTMHPSYSWVANLVLGTPVEVVPVVGPEAEVHHFQPSPEDLKRMADLDAIVVNGLGHDDFIGGMIEASGNRKAKIINPNTDLPLIPYAQGKSHTHGGESKEAPRRSVAYNPHTFLSLLGAVQQVYAIERALSELWPAQAEAFRANAKRYARRLRELKAATSARLAGVGTARVATVHDGYCYLLQEFGIEVIAVIEPAHGVEPSAKELATTIESIKAAGVGVVFSELSFPQKLVEMIRKETGARVYTFDHMSSGAYAADRFETAMRANVETLVKALVTEAKGP
ncbi:MAG TPA: zinc ABC transporter substrate-binding protein [Planctomycetota bacterium]|nr:zinc ABC transporter substrate-binding protein [Planctomycetota bacterium]